MRGVGRSARVVCMRGEGGQERKGSSKRRRVGGGREAEEGTSKARFNPKVV